MPNRNKVKTSRQRRSEEALKELKEKIHREREEKRLAALAAREEARRAARRGKRVRGDGEGAIGHEDFEPPKKRISPELDRKGRKAREHQPTDKDDSQSLREKPGKARKDTKKPKKGSKQ